MEGTARASTMCCTFLSGSRRKTKSREKMVMGQKNEIDT